MDGLVFNGLGGVWAIHTLLNGLKGAIGFLRTQPIYYSPKPTHLTLLVSIKVVNTVSASVSVWPLEWNISVPINTGVPFWVYHKYIYNTFLLPCKIINSKQVKSNNTNNS